MGILCCPITRQMNIWHTVYRVLQTAAWECDDILKFIIHTHTHGIVVCICAKPLRIIYSILSSSFVLLFSLWSLYLSCLTRIFHLSLFGDYGPCSASLNTWDPSPWGNSHTALERAGRLGTYTSMPDCPITSPFKCHTDTKPFIWNDSTLFCERDLREDQHPHA